MASFVTGLMSVVIAALNVATLVSPFLPGCDSTILANSHLQGGRRSSVIRTSEPVLISFDG